MKDIAEGEKRSKNFDLFGLDEENEGRGGWGVEGDWAAWSARWENLPWDRDTAGKEEDCWLGNIDQFS